MGYTMVTRLGGIEYRYTGPYSNWSHPLRNPLHLTDKSVRVAHTHRMAEVSCPREGGLVGAGGAGAVQPLGRS